MYGTGIQWIKYTKSRYTCIIHIIIKKDFIFKAIYIHKMVENSGCKYKGVKNCF